MLQNPRKTLRWTERCDNDVLNLVEEAMNDSDSDSDFDSDLTDSEDEILNMPKVIILYISTDHKAWNTN